MDCEYWGTIGVRCRSLSPERIGRLSGANEEEQIELGGGDQSKWVVELRNKGIGWPAVPWVSGVCQAASSSARWTLPLPSLPSLLYLLNSHLTSLLLFNILQVFNFSLVHYIPLLSWNLWNIH